MQSVEELLEAAVEEMRGASNEALREELPTRLGAPPMAAVATAEKSAEEPRESSAIAADVRAARSSTDAVEVDAVRDRVSMTPAGPEPRARKSRLVLAAAAAAVVAIGLTQDGARFFTAFRSGAHGTAAAPASAPAAA